MNAGIRNRSWRLILHKPANGAWNMAVDESILEAVIRQKVPPTLRLYAWETPCLSIGYAQSTADVDLHKLQSLRWDFVRRPSGGRAILHADELTYAVIGTLEEALLKGNLMESYRNLSRALLTALHLLGIHAVAEPNENITSSSLINNQEAICFEIPSHYEITANGMKLIGSAQVRRKSGVLQHGTLPLFGDLTRITQVLAYNSDSEREIAAKRLQSRSTTISDILNRQVDWETAAQAMVSSFEKVFRITLIQSDLTHSEIRRAEELTHEKYTEPQWTNKLRSKKD